MKYTNWLLAACILTLSHAHAAVDAFDANAATPAVTYRSPFEGYRPLGEDRNTPWKDANDTVGKIGGWRVYAREAAEAMKARDAAGEKRGKPETFPSAPVTPAAPSPQTHRHGG